MKSRSDQAPKSFAFVSAFREVFTPEQVTLACVIEGGLNYGKEDPGPFATTVFVGESWKRK